jgi:hypothetical protein
LLLLKAAVAARATATRVVGAPDASIPAAVAKERVDFSWLGCTGGALGIGTATRGAIFCVAPPPTSILPWRFTYTCARGELRTPALGTARVVLATLGAGSRDCGGARVRTIAGAWSLLLFAPFFCVRTIEGIVYRNG